MGHILYVNSPLSILNRLEPFLSQLDAPVNFGGPRNELNFLIFGMSVFPFMSVSVRHIASQLVILLEDEKCQKQIFWVPKKEIQKFHK